MKQTAFLFAMLLSVAASVPAADQTLLNMVMPDAKMLAGINVEQAKTSQFGQFLLATMPVNQEFQAFISDTSFDPRRDVREVLVASNTPHSVLAMARGNFDVSRLVATAVKQGETVSTYAGAQLLTAGADQDSHGVAFIDPTTVIAGDLASVKAALDRRNHTNSLDPALTVQINDLSTSLDAWSVSVGGFNMMMSPGHTGPAGSTLLKSVQQASGGVKFGANVQVSGQAVTKDAKDATALGDVIRFLATMVQTNAPNQTEKTLVQSLNVNVDGTTVKIAMTLPEDQLESLVKMIDQHSAKTSDEHSHI